MRPRAILSLGLGGTILGGTGGPTDPLEQYVLVTEGGRDTVFEHGDLGSTENIDPTAGNVHTGTLDDDCTITLLAPDTSRSTAATTIEVYLTEDVVGGWTPTFNADGGTISWLGGATPTHTTTAETTTVYIFETLDNGVTWLGGQLGSSPALTVQDEGSPLATGADTLNFVGDGVVASGTGSTKTITIPGGGADPAEDTYAWMPLTTVVGGEPVLVWDGDDNLIPTLTPV